VELPFEEIQEASEESDISYCQERVGSHVGFASVFALQPNEGAGTQRQREANQGGQKGQRATVSVTSGTDIKLPVRKKIVFGNAQTL
jgi:hypothetical protein